MLQKVTTTYLELTSPADLVPKQSPRDDVKILQAKIPSPELNRFLYVAVGREWAWNDRLPMSREKWLAYLDRPELETWVMYVSGTPAGYFELEMQPGESVEICYFGLLPDFVGLGLGGHLLTAAVERGWERGAKRVWLHTCTLDHPSALANYQARGFRVFRETVQEKDVPETRPWPG
jgi:GNAT superfamily N-acetyltransferase